MPMMLYVSAHFFVCGSSVSDALDAHGYKSMSGSSACDALDVSDAMTLRSRRFCVAQANCAQDV